MSIRESLQKKPALGFGVVVVLLAAATVIVLYSLGVFGGDEPQTSENTYYYDMQTQELFVSETDQVPPIKAPSGGEGVLARVYDCGGNCENGHYIGLLRKYSPAAKQAIEKGLPPNPAGELVRLTDAGSDWVPADSPAGQQMRKIAVAGAREFCKDKSPKICFPD